jgi:thioredoxin-dependent peroxiredoxin
VRDEMPRFRKLAVQPFGVNHAGLPSHEKYAAKFRFNFPLLCDPDRAVAASYRALKPDGKGIQRTVYLIGSDGRVLFARRGAPPADQVLAALG